MSISCSPPGDGSIPKTLQAEDEFIKLPTMSFKTCFVIPHKPPVFISCNDFQELRKTDGVLNKLVQSINVSFYDYQFSQICRIVFNAIELEHCCVGAKCFM